MFSKLLTLLISVILFLTLTHPVFAVTVTINTYPSTINDQPFTINASVSGASAGTNYLRIDLYKDQTTNYFGETFNGADYYNGSTYTQYLPITIQSGTTWNGDVQGRIGSPTSTQYDGVGTYKMRIRRYTSGGGNTAPEANDSAVTVSISVPSPTPTLTPTPTPAPTNTNTPTATKTPTSTPTPTRSTSSGSTTPTVTKKPASSPTPTEENLSLATTNIGTAEAVLGLNTDNPEDANLEENKPRLSLGRSLLAGGLAIVGIALVSLSGYSFFKGRADSPKEKSDTIVEDEISKYS